MNGGYIKLFRSLLSWEWYKDIPTKVLWIHILLKATHKETKVKGVDVPRGGLLTSVRELAAETGLTERKIRTALVHLQNSQNLTQKATNKGTLIIIENYGFYQSEGKETDTQTDTQPTRNRHTTDTPIEQESKNVRVSITKEYKDTNNNNNIYNYNNIGKVVDCAHARGSFGQPRGNRGEDPGKDCCMAERRRSEMKRPRTPCPPWGPAPCGRTEHDHCSEGCVYYEAFSVELAKWRAAKAKTGELKKMAERNHGR